MVGTGNFEIPASCSQSTRASSALHPATSAWPGSNWRPQAPRACALPAAPHAGQDGGPRSPGLWLPEPALCLLSYILWVGTGWPLSPRLSLCWPAVDRVGLSGRDWGGSSPPWAETQWVALGWAEWSGLGTGRPGTSGMVGTGLKSRERLGLNREVGAGSGGHSTSDVGWQ